MKKQDMRKLGSLGGKANVEANGKKHMKDIAYMGANARWKDKHIDKARQSVVG